VLLKEDLIAREGTSKSIEAAACELSNRRPYARPGNTSHRNTLDASNDAIATGIKNERGNRGSVHL
jgi:hypothetical protein